MGFKPFHIGNITIDLPVVQGGMGVGVSLSSLAGAVAAEGGLGVISCAHPGFLMPEFEANPLKANLEGLAHHVKLAKEKAKGGAIGVNIMTAMRHYEEYVKACVQNKVDVIFSGAGLPIGLPALTKNTATKIAPIVSSVKAAAVLLKMWDKRYNTTADALVVEGPKAGGHLGFKAEEVEQEQDFDAELKGILSFVKTYEEKYNHAIPVIFGGGVFDKPDVEKYLDMGCDAVQIASRFVATHECDAHQNFKDAYVKAKKEDIVIVKSPVGLPGRALMNDFVRSTHLSKQPIGKCYNCIVTCDPKDTPYCITKALIASVKGDVDNGLVFCGANTYRIQEITTVKGLMGELTG